MATQWQVEEDERASLSASLLDKIEARESRIEELEFERDSAQDALSDALAKVERLQDACTLWQDAYNNACKRADHYRSTMALGIGH